MPQAVIAPAPTCDGVYDNTAEPIKILLCDEGCDLVDGDATGAVSIELGCEGSLP